MEVISKQLHKNLLPIMLVTFGLFIVTVILSTNSGIILAQGLVTQVVHIEPGKNGLAHISKTEEQTNLGQIGQSAGRASGLSLILESTALEVK